MPGDHRHRVTTGIGHAGAGGFHRADQAMYLDRLLSTGIALDRGICGAGVLAANQKTEEALTPQDRSTRS